MKRILPLLLLSAILDFSCNSKSREGSVEKWKQEIIETEQEFAEMAQKAGIPEAFLAFAAEDAVLLRNNRIIIGRDSISASYENINLDHVNLIWKPDFVDVALSGDLGYTYGKYVFTTTDSTGNTNETEGIFHTVWKRQPDGTWKFVWD